MPELTDNPAEKASPYVLIRAPMAPVAGAMIAGILAGRYLPAPMGLWLSVGAVGFLVAAVTLLRRHLRTLTALAMMVTILCIGAARLQTACNTVATDAIITYTGQARSMATIRGRIASYPQIVQPAVEFGYRPEPRLKFLLDTEAVRTSTGWRKVGGLVRVSVDEPYRTFQPGDRVEILGWMGRYNPPDNPGEFDAAAAARLSGVGVWFRAYSEDAVTVLDPAGFGGAGRWLWRLRAIMRQRLMETGDLQNGRLVGALVLGERHPSLGTLNRTMQRAGIAHFLSISGLHLGVFLGFVYLLGRGLTFSPRRAAIGVLVVLVCYLLLAEPRPPLLRSAIMAGALAVGVISGRRHSSLNALAVAAVVLLLIDPRQLMQPGFQLSFGIVTGIILLNARVRKLLFGRWLARRGLMVFRRQGRLRRLLYYRANNAVINLVSISTTAYLVAAPLAAMHFGIFSPLAIVLSVLLFPPIVAILIPGYVSMALAIVAPNLSAVVGRWACGAAGLLATIVRALEALPFLSVSMRPVGPVWAGVYYMALLAVLLAGRSRVRRVLAGAAVGVFLAATIVTQLPAKPDGAAELHMLSVGSGQCAVLQTPAGKTFLLDAGTRGGFDAYQRVLSPFLRIMRLPDPAAAIVSHANTDHYNALGGLVRDGRIGCVYLCDYFRSADEQYSAESRMLDLFDDCDVAVLRLRSGWRLDLDSRTHVEVLWPPANRRDLTTNDTSLVLRVVCDGKSVLLPGDIGPSVQAELLKNPSRLAADVLVLPHHGKWNNTLPAFVQAVGPTIILVSSGSDPQGPSVGTKQAREFYRKLRKDYRYYSTPRNGWVGLTFGGDKIDVKTMR
jgi:competence protein ComEC